MIMPACRCLMLIGLVGLAACAETQPTRFYTLAPVLDAGTAAATQGGLVVGVGPVTLPAYLERSQIVTRSGPNRAELAEFDSWIEPLDSMVPRVLAEDLARLLGTDDVLTLPARRAMPLDYQVEIEILRLDADPAGNAVLDARWRVFDRNDDPVGGDRTTVREDVAQPGDYRALAAAMSRALGTLARDIAAVIGSPSA